MVVFVEPCWANGGSLTGSEGGVFILEPGPLEEPWLYIYMNDSLFSLHALYTEPNASPSSLIIMAFPVILNT